MRQVTFWWFRWYYMHDDLFDTTFPLYASRKVYRIGILCPLDANLSGMISVTKLWDDATISNVVHTGYILAQKPCRYKKRLVETLSSCDDTSHIIYYLSVLSTFLLFKKQLCFIMILIINDLKWKHDFLLSSCDGKAIGYNGNRLGRYVTVTVSTIPDRKSKRHENLSGMVFSTTGLVNTHVIFVFRHGKHLM